MDWGKLVLFGSKLITYKKEKTGRVASSQPGGTSLLGRLLRVDDRGVRASRCGYSGRRRERVALSDRDSGQKAFCPESR